jgi:hypothetical protein
MVAWFSKYYKTELFRFTGDQTSTYAPTRFYKHFFKNNFVEWLTLVNRRVFHKNREIVNKSFLEFLESPDGRGIVKPQGYRMNETHIEGMYRSAAKYDRPDYNVEPAYWLLAISWLRKMFFPYMCNSIILDQASAIKQLNMATSAGWPANIENHSKKEFLETDSARILQDFWEIIGGNPNNVVDLKGLIAVAVWCASAKKEVRDVTKIMAFGAEFDKFRTFTAAPIEHQVACTRLYFDMNNKFYDSAGKTWSYVGASKYYQGWNCLFNTLNKHKNAHDLDETDYDASLLRVLLEAVRDFRWECLNELEKTPETWLRHCATYEMIIHSIMVLDFGDLCQKHSGNPSGSANTIVDNTLALFILIAYAFIKLYYEKYSRDPSYEFFVGNVEAALCGDDNSYTNSDEVEEFFPVPEISRVWTSIGVKTKYDTPLPKKLKDIRFLSHGFVYNSGFWLPSPETNRVLCSLLYGSKKDDIRWHLMRAHALLLESWPNEDCRHILKRYIAYVYSYHQKELVGSVRIDDNNKLSMLEINNLQKSDAEIWMLYTGNESQSSSIMVESECLNIRKLDEILDIQFNIIPVSE